MRVQTSLLRRITAHHTRQARVPRCPKAAEGESTSDPVRKKLIFRFKPVLLKIVPSLPCSVCSFQHFVQLVPVNSASDCLVGKLPPTCYLHFFFPILINDVASNDSFFSWLANNYFLPDSFLGI